ncbi:MAG TPA: TetR/AcrR family transcriptional regulator [Micromonosporaceae bacterium]|jgi:AcrR family transcriptional regulator|nr:TetR/AcrR family transcriptional regulator [Micromonosporaceae bacterium]
MGAPRSPGRPRSARVDEAIITAVLDLLAEGVAAGSITIEAVATRAGVGKATIYRRWPNKEALLVDAIVTMKGSPPELKGESVRDDLVALLRPIGQHQNPHPAQNILPCLISELHRNDEMWTGYQKVVEPRRQLMRDVLRRGMRTGELKPDLDVELVAALLTGPVLIQHLLRWNPNLDRETMPERVVDAVLNGIGAG